MQLVKTRFSPSPTGLMHLGNARTALFSALLAKHNQGVFLLRIEDTDPDRSKRAYVDSLMLDLQWLGLVWQEGPYYQSQRQSIYDDYYECLAARGLSYPCFCSEDELALARKVQLASGRPPRYAGTCRHLSQQVIEANIAQGKRPLLRFRVPDHEVIEYQDFVRGYQRFNTDDIGDFVIRRHDGSSPFVFCNAIDDALMQVTHVMRGEDHISNTPRQLMLLHALDLHAPQYGHISLITALDGSPLSKRTGSRSVEALRLEGYLPEAVLNYLARLGHYYGHDELLSLEELGIQFSLDRLAKSPAKFNLEQLNFWQKEAVRHVDAQRLWDWLAPEEQALVPQQHREAFLELLRTNVQWPQDLKRWVAIVFGNLPPLGADQKQLLLQTSAYYFECAVNALEQFDKDYQKIMAYLSEQVAIKGKALYQPFRVALTGELHGPELAVLLCLMDQAVVKQRMLQAAQR